MLPDVAYSCLGSFGMRMDCFHMKTKPKATLWTSGTITQFGGDNGLVNVKCVVGLWS